MVFVDNINMKSENEIKQNASFWNRFKTICKDKGITQVELCNKTRIDKGKLQGQITRDIAPSVFEAQKIADCLGVSMEYLTIGIEKDSYKDKYESLRTAVQDAIDNN